MMTMRFKGAGALKRTVIVLVQILLIGYVLLILYPLFNMLMSSFKRSKDILMHPFELPTEFEFGNYIKVWVDRGFGRYFYNSLWITGSAMAMVLLFGSLAAYGISRFRFRGNTLVYMLFLSGIMLPLKAAVIPLFQIVKALGMYDKPIGVICIFIAMGLPSTVFILAGSMRTIPSSLSEAATIDGCGEFMIYRRIVMPIIMPSVALVTIYNAVPIWNDFFFPLVFIKSDKLKTLPLGLTSFMGQYATAWDMLFTGLAIAIVPVMILYLSMSKYFIKGMTAGAIK